MLSEAGAKPYTHNGSKQYEWLDAKSLWIVVAVAVAVAVAVVAVVVVVTERISGNLVVPAVLGILGPVTGCSRQTTGRVIRTVSPLGLLPHPGQNK